jgi:hypothetical protein
MTITENETVSFKGFTAQGYEYVCGQFGGEYADTLNKHMQHLALIGDINGNKLFDPDRSLPLWIPVEDCSGTKEQQPALAVSSWSTILTPPPAPIITHLYRVRGLPRTLHRGT